MVSNIEDYENYISVICTNTIDKEENTYFNEYNKEKDEYILISDPIKRIAEKRY